LPPPFQASSARVVSRHGVEFLAKNFAADGEALLGIAQGRKKQGIEACFAGDLSHHVHQTPGKATGGPAPRIAMHPESENYAV